jgi:hypothetical protein
MVPRRDSQNRPNRLRDLPQNRLRQALRHSIRRSWCPRTAETACQILPPAAPTSLLDARVTAIVSQLYHPLYFG